MQPGAPTHCFVFRGNRLLVRSGKRLVLPKCGDIGEGLSERAEMHRFPSIVKGSYLVYDLPADEDVPAGMRPLGLRAVFGTVGEFEFYEAGRAYQLLEWQRTHRHCGRCGEEAHRHPSELANVCPSCGHLMYPRVNPAVIVRVEHDGKILLIRSPSFPEGMYSVFAGFVEPGESLEYAATREAMEELGIELRDIRYFGSQPWPFPHSLMVAFVAGCASPELSPDGEEVAEAGWYGPNDLPEISPRLSIARALIDDFCESRG